MIQIGQNVNLDELAEKHWMWLKRKINYDEIKKKPYNDCVKILNDLKKTEVEKKNCALKVILKDHLYDQLEGVIKASLVQLKNIKQNTPSLFLNDNYFILKRKLETKQEKLKETLKKWHNQCNIANGKKRTSEEVKEKQRLRQEYKNQKIEYDYLKSEKDRIYSEFVSNITVRYLKKDESGLKKERSIPVNLNDLLHYDNLRDDPEWNAYVLCNSLNVSVCPYCNRQYIFLAEKHEGGWISSAQLDHFLPKSSNPLFSCSFYNLIPSCYCCNHGKLDSSEETIYPYADSFEKDGIFCIDFSEEKKIEDLNLQKDIVVKIDVTECRKKTLIENSKKVFHLEELYNKHQLEIHDFVKRFNCCMECRQRDFQNITIREDLLNDNQKSELILGMPLDAEATEYPLKKMKTDILEQLEKKVAFKLR